MINGKFILEIINYFVLSFIFIFGLLSLLLKDQKKKLTFLFLVFLFTGIASFLFFAESTFVLVGIVILFFFLLFYSLIFHQEFFGFGREFYIENIQKKQSEKRAGIYFRRIAISRILNLILSLISCFFIGYLFYNYTKDFYANIVMVKNLSSPLITDVLNDIGLNYIPVVLLIVIGLFSIFIWITAILPHVKKKQ